MKHETKVGSTIYHVSPSQLALIKVLAKQVKLPWQSLAARPKEVEPGLQKWFTGREIRFRSFGDTLDGIVRNVDDGRLIVGTQDGHGATEAVVTAANILKLGRKPFAV